MAYIRKISRKKGIVYKAEVCQFDGSKRSGAFRTKEEALTWARAQEDLKRNQRSQGITTVRMDLDAYFQKWFDEYARFHHSTGWQMSDRRMYEKYVGPFIGKMMIRNIQPVDVQRVLQSMRKQDLKASYANRVRVMLNKMFSEAVKTHRFLSFNPVSAVRPFKEDPHVATTLSQEEASKLLSWADTHRHGLILHLALQLGLREGEIIGLKWDAVNLDQRQIAIRRKWQKNSKTLDEFAKGRKVRSLGIYPDGLLERLCKQRERLPNAEFVISEEDGGRVSPIQTFKTLRQGLKATGVTRVTMHELRHTFATLYMQNGGDLYDLQKILGHQSASTTERYRHTDPEYLRRKCNVFDLYANSAQTPPTAGKPDLRLVASKG